MDFPSASYPPVRPARERVLGIDLARIISASLLFYYHVDVSSQWPFSAMAGNTTFVFIFLAGFCAIRFSRTLASSSTSVDGGWLSYPLARVRKLYLTYWIVTFVIFFGSFIHPANEMQGAFHLKDLVMNLFGLNQYFGERYFSRTMWFAPFVVQIYFLIPLFQRIPFPPVKTMIGCFLISATLCLLVFRLFPANASEICRTWSPLFRLPTVYLGIAVALYPAWSQRWKILATFVAGAGLLALAAPHWQIVEVTFSRPWNCFVLGALIGVSAWLLSKPLSLLPPARKAIIRLGKASYPFFLIHGVLISMLWHRFGPDPWILVPYFFGCWGMAWLIGEFEHVLRKQFYMLKTLRAGRRKNPEEDSSVAASS